MLLQFWKLKNVILCSSRYALPEARIKLTEEAQRRRLARLAGSIQLFDVIRHELPRGVALPDKDVPILLAATGAKASHFITGDLRHFGPYFGRSLGGMLLLSPGEYLKTRRPHSFRSM
ncbi:MAG TPA: hypothetical protein VI455_13100 [Terriglobia bacterium]